MFKKQVDKEHYRFSKYSYPGRWGSYYWQLATVLDSNPESVVEIGVGDGVFGRYLEEIARVDYASVDVAEDLKPDIIGSVTKMPIPDDSYDVACCFQVLEHLPFDVFETALKELVRISRRRVIISVPDCRPYIRISFKLPLVPELLYIEKLPFSHQVRLGGGHQWEIGYPGFPLSRIIEIIQRHGILIKDFVPFENPYHHFLVLEK
jgi:hypothetical protein